MSETLGTSSQLQLTIPISLETDWATTIRDNCFQKIVEHDHTGSAGKGIKIATAAITDNAVTGAKILLGNNIYLRGRNAADSADKDIVKVNASDELQFGTTIGSINIQDDGLTILDNADNTKIIAFNASNITTGTTRTLSAPDATGTIVLNDNTVALTNKTIDADSNTITNIENADIKAAAAIALNKLAATTASRALASDASGFVTASATTDTELGYVSGVTSAIQTQINAKAPSASPTFTGTITTPLTASRAVVTGASNELAASATTDTEIGYVSGVTSAIQTQLNAKLPTTITTTGDIIYSSSGTTASRLAIGTAGQVLQVSGGLPAWGTNTASPIAVQTKTTTYTALTTDDTILADTSVGAFTITLYAAASNSGRRLTIKKTTADVNAVTIDGNALETIDGSLTVLLYHRYQSIELECDGSNWHILNSSHPLNDSKTATFTASQFQELYLCDATAGAITANLPAAAACKGEVFEFVKTDSSTNAVTIDPNSTETIFGLGDTTGATTFKLPRLSNTVRIVSTGVAWRILSADCPVVCAMSHGTGTSIDNAASGTLVPWDTAVLDTHGGMSGGTYTVPRAGVYQISGTLAMSSSSTWADTEIMQVEVYNGASLIGVSRVTAESAGANKAMMCWFNTSFSCAASSTLTVKIYQTSGAALAMLSTSSYNRLIITQIA